MVYRHSIYVETASWENLAQLASGVAAQRLKLEFIPRVHFFKEDAAGRFEKPMHVAGFFDFDCSPADPCVFVRGNMSAAEAVENDLP